jgi:hypothetical protein
MDNCMQHTMKVIRDCVGICLSSGLLADVVAHGSCSHVEPGHSRCFINSCHTNITERIFLRAAPTGQPSAVSTFCAFWNDIWKGRQLGVWETAFCVPVHRSASLPPEHIATPGIAVRCLNDRDSADTHPCRVATKVAAEYTG